MSANKQTCCCLKKPPPGELQACCDEFGGCQDLTVAECLAQGWAPQGKGTECLDGLCDLLPCPGTQRCFSFPETLAVAVAGFVISCPPDFTNLAFDCVVQANQNPANPCSWFSESRIPCGTPTDVCEPIIRVAALFCTTDEGIDIWDINFLLLCVYDPPLALGVNFHYMKPVTGDQSPIGTYSYRSHLPIFGCQDETVILGSVQVS